MANEAQDIVQKGTELIQQTGTGDVGWLWSFFQSGWGSTILVAVQFLLGLGFLVFGAGIVYRYWLRYNISVTLWRQTAGGGKQKSNTRAMITRDDQGKRKLELLKKGEDGEPLTCPVPDSKYKTLKRGGFLGGAKDHYDLELDDGMNLHPVNPELSSDLGMNDKQKMRTQAQEREAWSNLETKNLKEKYETKSWFERNKDFLTIVFVGIIAFLMLYFVSQNVASSFANLAQQVGEMQQACANIGG